MRQRESNMISIVSAFAIGSLIGAGIALLMAPQSGMDTRQMIRNKSMEIKDRAVSSVGDTKDKAKGALEDITSKTRKTASTLRRRGREMAESITE